LRAYKANELKKAGEHEQKVKLIKAWITTMKVKEVLEKFRMKLVIRLIDAQLREEMRRAKQIIGRAAKNFISRGFSVEKIQRRRIAITSTFFGVIEHRKRTEESREIFKEFMEATASRF